MEVLKEMARYSDDRSARECDAAQAAITALEQCAALLSLGPKKGICSWCGMELYGEADPIARMKAHQRECPAHPMREVERQRQALKEALERSLSYLTSYPGGGANSCYEQARAALALTKEKADDPSES
jgi:hypothetical protein